MEKINFLHQTLNQISLVSEKEVEFLLENSKEITLEKGEFLLKEGQTAKSIYFVLSGIFRVYQNIDGKEVTSYFSYSERNPFAASFPSFLTQSASNEYVEAIESSLVVSISFDQLNKLYESSKSFERLGRILAEKNYLLAMERISSLQYQSAGDRYNIFMKIYPGLLNRIPHHYIASYLGVTPESLSRIRKDLASSESK
jgi:CRP-like cAMP-binding protein